MASAALAQACQSLSWPGDPQTGFCTPNAVPKAGSQPSLAVRAHRLLFSSLLTRRHFLQSCFLSPWLPTQTAARGYPVPHAGLPTCLRGIPAVPGTAAFQPIIPPSLVPSNNSLRVHNIPPHKLLMNKINSIRPGSSLGWMQASHLLRQMFWISCIQLDNF